ncbi:MAG: lytic transglycosylase domain-containing protein [Synergistaceae bacterium]|jgi:soluble lytic murein transglycosylase-like protein|nr:lytic transglycosylase domain-containing protein [Synergistaceae bacterium]
MRMTNISRVLGRMKEIEALIYPAPTPESPAERFQDVLAEKLDDPYAEEDGFTPLDDISVPESVAERLAMWEPDLQELSGKYGVDPDLARAVMRQESGGNPNAVSSAGALGLMQLMPGTAKGLGVDPMNPKRNLEGGIKYLAQLADKYDGDYVKTLAAYNAGSARVDSYGGIPPFPETERYVKNVLALYRKYSRGD